MAHPQARLPRSGPPRHQDRAGDRPPRRRTQPAATSTPGSPTPARPRRPAPPASEGTPSSKKPSTRNNSSPVCSPGLLKARGRPESPADLWGWPLLYDLGWDSDWAYWATQQNQPAPDLTRASGFRLYSILIDAATQGVGAAIGRTTLIERELQHRTLVPALQHQEDAPERCCLITTEASRQRPEVQALRQWLLQQTQTTNQPANHPNP